MNLSFEEVANSTVKVQCGDDFGSGFHLFRKDIVVTNHHVVEDGDAIFVKSEHGTFQPANLITHSPKTEKDFAILQLVDDLPEPRTVLQPLAKSPERGTELIFAGYPHGESLDDLLVRHGRVAAPYTFGFYIDGSVNGGDSGGPTVDLQSGQVLGVVTYRRFFNQDELRAAAETGRQLAPHAARSRGLTTFNDIDLMAVVAFLAQGVHWVAQSIEANSSLGIGMAIGIDWVVEEYKRVGLSS